MALTQEVEEFYAARGLHINKLIARRPDGVSPAQIKEAAERVHYTLKHGKKVKPINIARVIKRAAKRVSGAEFAKDEQLLRKYKEIILEKEEKIKLLDRKVFHYSAIWFFITMVTAYVFYSLGQTI